MKKMDNMRTINHEQLYELLVVNSKAKHPTMIYGGVGIGKTFSVRKFSERRAEEFGLEMVEDNVSDKYSYIALHLATLPMEDIRGLPIPDREKKVVEYMVLNFLPRDEKAKGTLFLDEFNLAEPPVQKAAYQLILDRRLGDYVLPDGFVVVGAGNRDKDNCNVFRLPEALNDRWGMIELGSPTGEDWLYNFASKNGVRTDVQAYMAYKPAALNNETATPRSWQRVSEVLDVYEKAGVSVLSEEDVVAQWVGIGYASEFIAFKKLNNEVDINKLLDNPQLVEGITEMDVRFCICGALVDKFVTKKDNLNKVIGVIQYMPSEYGFHVLRSMKNYDTHDTAYRERLVKCSNWKPIAEQYNVLFANKKE